MPAEAMFAAARAIGEQIAAQRAADRQAVRDARNARRRARYAARPTTATEPQAADVIDDGWLPEPGCYCHIVRMPPCAWCENGGDPYEESDPAR